MNKRFVIFSTKAAFTSATKGNQYDDNSIVFIKDTKEIWTHATSFQSIPDGGTDGQVLTFKDNKIVWADVEDQTTEISSELSQLTETVNGLKDSKVDWSLGKTTIILPNDGKIIGKNSSGDDNATLVSMSSNNKVEVGSSSYGLNLNGPALNHPTYNETESIAFVSDITDLGDDIDEQIESIISGLIISDKTNVQEAKTALTALGTNYSTLYKVASTLKSFLEDSDTADSTINKWKEIEAFLADITDTETLTGLIEDLHSEITDEIESAITDLDIEQYETIEGAASKYPTIAQHNLKADKTEIADMATKTWVNSQEYLVDSDIENLAQKATTLAGYGITDAKIEDGVITLGNQTITPLTSHQSLANYYTKAEVDAMWEWGEY